MGEIKLDKCIIEEWLNNLAKQHWKPDNTWRKWWARDKNKEIKKMLAEKGDKCFGLYSYYSGKGRKEFLYDFCWVRREKRKDGKSDRLIEVVMAAEMEFSDRKLGKGHLGGIRFDFNKLLQSDARYKIMFFQMPLKEEVESHAEKLICDANSYYSKFLSEVFICGWPWGDKEKRFRCYSVKLEPKRCPEV